MDSRIGKNAAVLTASKIITLLISLISSMLLSRFRSLEEYGTYSQLLTITTLMSSLFMLGLPNSTNYFLARAESGEERRHFLAVYYSLSTLLSILIGAVLVFSVSLWADYFRNPLIQSFVYFLAVLPWTKVIIGSISNVLVVYGKSRLLLLTNIVNTAVSLIAVLAVQLFGWSFGEYMMIFLLGESAIAIWVYWIVSRLENSIHFSLDTNLIKKIFVYSIPLGLAGFVGTISLELGKLMIGHLFDTEMMAIYTNAGKELPFTIVAASLTAVLLPQIAKLLKDINYKRIIKLWGDSIEVSFIFICFFTMVCIVFAPQMISILYSDKYLPGVNVFRVYSAVMLLRVTYFGMVLSSAGKTKLVLYSSIASMIINVVLNYLMYLLLGFIGPAVATFLSILLMQWFQLYRTKDILHVSMRDIFPWKRLGKIGGVNIALGIVLFFAMKFANIDTSAKGNIVAVCIGIAAAGIYAVIFRRKVMSLWRGLNSAEEGY